jgi:hypothetical protein
MFVVSEKIDAITCRNYRSRPQGTAGAYFQELMDLRVADQIQASIRVVFENRTCYDSGRERISPSGADFLSFARFMRVAPVSAQDVRRV